MLTLLEQYNLYTTRLKAKGRPLLTYVPPCCGKPLETLDAPANERWSTLACCPHCNGLYMKITEHGKVTALKLQG